MANFPNSLDSFVNPDSTDDLTNPSHSLQHADANDAIEAIERKLGIGDSSAGSATQGWVLTAGTAGETAWESIPTPTYAVTSGTADYATNAGTATVLTSGTATAGHVLTANGSGGSIYQGQFITFAVERNGGFTTGAGQYGAFGNGAADGLASLPFNAFLVGATMRVTAAHTGTTTVQFNINGTNQGTGYQLSCTGASSSNSITPTPLLVTSGQGFNWNCTAISGTLGTTIITMIFRIA